MAQATLEASRGIRCSNEKDLLGTRIEFVCIRPSHVESAIPDDLGRLITHSGAYGYCFGHALGPHEWAPSTHATLGELVLATRARARSAG